MISGKSVRVKIMISWLSFFLSQCFLPFSSSNKLRCNTSMLSCFVFFAYSLRELQRAFVKRQEVLDAEEWRRDSLTRARKRKSSHVNPDEIR